MTVCTRAFNGSLYSKKTKAKRLTLEGNGRDLLSSFNVGFLIWEQQFPCIIIGVELEWVAISLLLDIRRNWHLVFEVV
jgi:hypothetical protein